jgi:hypothetical protein
MEGLVYDNMKAWMPLIRKIAIHPTDKPNIQKFVFLNKFGQTKAFSLPLPRQEIDTFASRVSRHDNIPVEKHSTQYKDAKSKRGK